MQSQRVQANAMSMSEPSPRKVSTQLPASAVHLYEGKRVAVWHYEDGRAYEGTVKKLSESEIEVVYQDGSRNRHRRDGSIVSKLLIGEVSNMDLRLR